MKIAESFGGIILKKSKSGLGCGTFLIAAVGIGLLVTYWYVFLIAVAIGIGIWLYLRGKKHRVTEKNESQQLPMEQPSDNQSHNDEVQPHPVNQPFNHKSVGTTVSTSHSSDVNEHHRQTINQPKVHKIRRALHSYVVFDIETTGLSPQLDEIIQLSAIKIEEDSVVDEFDHYIKPSSPIPEQIFYLTGITNDIVSSAPSIKEVMPKFIQFVGGLPLVGHNIIKFDIPFIINNGFSQADIEALDTWQLAKRADFPETLPNLKLPTLKKYFGINRPSHNAIQDCKTNAEVYVKLRDKQLDPVPIPEVQTTHELDKLRFAITGEFIGISREDLIELITIHGGRVTASVSKATDYLLDGKQFSDRLSDGIHSLKELNGQKLIQSGAKLQIIGIDDLKHLIGQASK